MSRRHSIVLLSLAAATSACTSVDFGTDATWTYSTDASTPTANFGPPATMAMVSFECRPTERRVDVMLFDGEVFAGDRPVTINVGDASLQTIERLDPPDGIVASRLALPLNNPVIGRFATGTSPMQVNRKVGRLQIPSHPTASRVIAECNHLANARSPDISASALLDGLLGLKQADGVGNFRVTGKSPSFAKLPFRISEPYPKDRENWPAYLATRVVRAVRSLNEGASRQEVELGPARRIGEGAGVLIDFANPLVIDDIAVIQGNHSATGAYFYIFAWQDNRWVHVASALGPIF